MFVRVDFDVVFVVDRCSHFVISFDVDFLLPLGGRWAGTMASTSFAAEWDAVRYSRCCCLCYVFILLDIIIVAAEEMPPPRPVDFAAIPGDGGHDVSHGGQWRLGRRRAGVFIGVVVVVLFDFVAILLHLTSSIAIIYMTVIDAIIIVIIIVILVVLPSTTATSLHPQRCSERGRIGSRVFIHVIVLSRGRCGISYGSHECVRLVRMIRLVGIVDV
mmetsp:Transcript_32466/g.68081  ORF Transcript_32466/g.68081 Transcript_32466/m.68081 type:complete len:216 (+) Transcript_32466:3258-3905(+)